MEVVDNAIILVIPGAMDAGLGDILFWGSLSFALAVAGFCRLPGQPLAARARQGPRRRARDRHPRRPDPKVVGVIAVMAGVFGIVVLLADAL